MISKKLAMICATLFFSSMALAGGDLPFPYDSDNELPVLESQRWTVAETNLVVDLKVYLDTKDGGTQWIKIWIRDANDFVYSRTRLQKTGDALLVPVEVGGQKGQIAIDLAAPSSDFLLLNGQKFALMPAP